MKPYFETKNGKLYHGDCLEIVDGFIDKSFDLALTDPPYGIGAYKTGTMGGGVLAKQSSFKKTKWDNKIPDKNIFSTIFKYSENQIIFGGNYFVEYLKNSPCWIVWDKDNGNNNFADSELAWTSFNSAVRNFKYRWQGMLQENAGKHKEKRYHPTQKPTGLFKQILLKYSTDGQSIFDPFAGSGTTGLACEDIGNRYYVLIEKEEKYCEISAKRIEAETKQLRLF